VRALPGLEGAGRQDLAVPAYFSVQSLGDASGRVVFYRRSTRLLLVLIRGRKQFLAGAGQSDGFGVRNVAAIPGANAFDANDVTNFQRIPRPAIPQELVRTVHFKAPIRHRTVILFDVDVKPGVWIRPLEFRDRAGHLDGF